MALRAVFWVSNFSVEQVMARSGNYTQTDVLKKGGKKGKIRQQLLKEGRRISW
tara:strand:+ start:4061 stop:4219 length:159 start_codon:yes stop_codon:yes gene_type:complete